MRVEQADVGALDELVPLFDAYRQFYEQPSDPDAARAYLAQRLGAGEAVVYVARDDDGRALGFTLLYCTFTSVAMKPLVILNDLYTVPEARGRGIGTALIGEAEAFARAHGAGVLRLRTAHTNETAQRVYERLGFVNDLVFRTYDLRL